MGRMKYGTPESGQVVDTPKTTDHPSIPNNQDKAKKAKKDKANG